ncbi:beta-ketoacyl synthase domain-containing protein [Stachybotrys elegans]|uniref:Beta-ketoacyl synthase domain-containing protein n=1 Tax=Stachybotrys elegans TaxID=80388 RepID=A0A8K0SZD7_9HYPO|nr:beta-ketoacyl synthase domain-containing protein [Stachybotrys elegans]
MADKMSFLLFGDFSHDTHALLANLYRDQSLGVLTKSFIEEAGLALRDEVATSEALFVGETPCFRSIKQLNEACIKGNVAHGGIGAALLTTAQLAEYIDRVEKHGDIAYPGKSYSIGVGVGQVAAGAAACAQSPLQMLSVSVQAVRLAFRLGSHVEAVAQQFHQGTVKSDVWTHRYVAVAEDQAQAKVARFNASKARPLTNQAYISAVHPSYVEVSGPPRTLRDLQHQGVLGVTPVVSAKRWPYHASHLHSSADVERILHGLEESLPSQPGRHLFISSNGETGLQEQSTSLWRGIVNDCLSAVVGVHRVLRNCIEAAGRHSGGLCSVSSYGADDFRDTLVQVLRAETDLSISVNSLAEPSSPPLPVPSTRSGSRCKLAIVGMSGRFPDADSHEALWDLLCQGLDVHRKVPKDRFSLDTHYDPTGRAINTTHTPYGCWIKNPGLFDPRFFNMSPREALQTDPMQRLAIATAYEALEMAGYVPNRTPSTRLDRIGTFYGQTSDDWREINAAQDIDTYFITGGVRAFGPGRINYHFGFSGPSLSIDTACSSSAAALQVACTSLWARECDTAVVGGLSVLGNPDIFCGLSRGQFLSKTGPCATFDNAADGYCRADGCASVIVKRLDDALEDRDNVLAVILGTATNHSADAISITHPHGPTQSALSSAILEDAGVDPTDVDYVEMHGTGTQAGDGTEMVSVTSVFAPADKKRPADRPLYLGAIKSNVGHGEAASGVTALCKVLLMFQKNLIPPHVGIKAGSIMNTTFPKDLSERNVNIAFHLTPFKRSDGRPRRVFVNNFSAAGGNTGLLLEDSPARQECQPDPRGTHIIAITAKSKSSMIRNAERLVDWMRQHPQTPVSHVAYTTTARRIQHHWRLNVTASSLAEAEAAIQEKLASRDSLVPPVAANGKKQQIAFLFTGQGSHYVGMGQELYAHCSVFRKAIDSFNDIARLHGFPSFLSLLDGSARDLDGLSPVQAQLGLCCLEMALARLWASWGVQPDVVVGHSLGEYAALHAAGVLSASDTIFLVGKRAELLVDKCTPGTHAMLAVQGPLDSVMAALDSHTDIDVACINSPRETVLSGKSEKTAEVSAQLAEGGFKCTKLNVPFAFHSAQVEPILEEFEALGSNIHFSKPTKAIISPMLGRPLGDEEIAADYLRKHAREAVDFCGSIEASRQSGIIDDKTLWIEVGPHPVCTNLIKATLSPSTAAAASLRRNKSAFEILSTSLCSLHSAGLDINWNEFHKDFADSTRLLDLPAYSFDDKNYWIQYEGDWCLTKGRQPTPVLEDTKPVKPTLSTPSVHGVVKEEVDGETVRVETETDLSREDIKAAVTGHLCNGTPLCPSSLYADMAMTVSDYAYKLLRPEQDIGLNVADMEVPKTLIYDDSKGPQILHCLVVANVATGTADVSFFVDQGTSRTTHATCRVLFGDKEAWSNDFEKVHYLIHSRVDSLLADEKTGKASKIGRGLAYKLFTALVDYSKRYQGMQEVILDSELCEATAKVSLQTNEDDESFFFNPFWIDSTAHISGFIINGTDAVDSREQVFVSHGWGSLRFVEKLSSSKQYRSYVRMQPIKGTKMMSGDVYVFHDDRIIGIVGDLRFQSIPRKVLNVVLPPRGSAAVAPVPKKALPSSSEPRKTSPTVPDEASKRITTENLGAVNAKLTRSITASFLEILKTEIGCEADELVDNIAFADLGCDSLMALTVSGRMREELDIDVDSHAFLEHQTIGEFKQFLIAFEPQGAAPPLLRRESTGKVSSASASTGFASDSGLDADSAITTPTNESDDMSLKPEPAGSTELRDVVRSTIAREIGVDVEEIVAAPDLTALGVDSLMALTISGHLRETTDLDLPGDLFSTGRSLADIEKILGVGSPKPEQRNGLMVTPAARVINTHPGNTTATIYKPPPPTEIVDDFPHRKAKSILLQGSIRNATRNLFMLPDGGGSSLSYGHIGKILPEWAVWGLFSPFMKTPREFNCGVYGIAAKFIEEMKNRQPVGPYALAGWSAGGVVAYEMVNQLTRAGEVVDKLILIDSPCPVIIEPLPNGLHAWFAEIGILGEDNAENNKKIPDWLLPHFESSIKALSNYTAVPIPRDKCPQVTAIWCEDGVCKNPQDPRPDPYPTGHALFLLDNRVDFGPNRWDEYLDIDKIQTRRMPGNHFSMMTGDLAKHLGVFMNEALAA